MLSYNIYLTQSFLVDPFYPGLTSTPSKAENYVPIQQSPVVLQNTRYYKYRIMKRLITVEVYVRPGRSTCMWPAASSLGIHVGIITACMSETNKCTSRVS